MFKCRNCEHEFVQPELIYEPDGLDTPPYRYSDCCPNCFSDDFSEIIDTCDCCGMAITAGEKYYKTNNNYLFCDNCIMEVNT